MIDYAVTNPATGEQIKTYPTITDAELEAAIGLAHQTHQNWLRSTTVDERAKLVRRVGELHSERREQLAEITVREMGKPTEQALGEIDFCVDIYGYYADNGPALMKDEPIQLLAGEGSAIIRRSSLGVILGIMPWNFPTYQVARFAGPGLIIGNAVLLKHAPQCPETAEALQQIYLDAGFPEGAYVNIYATNDQIATRHRRPARAGRVGDRLGARRCGGGRDRRPEPEEGRARAGRLRPVHPAQHRRPRRDRRVSRQRPPGQRRPVVQRRQAVRRDRRAVRAVPREVHGRHDGVEDRATRPPTAPSSARCPRAPRPTGSRISSTARSRAAPRSSPAASAPATSSRRWC